MEQLSPTERAVFILRDAFGYSHRDVAELVGVSEKNSRQLHRRARQQVPQGRVDGDAEIWRGSGSLAAFGGPVLAGRAGR